MIMTMEEKQIKRRKKEKKERKMQPYQSLP